MNIKMTFPELVDAVSAVTQSPKRVSEIFLKELFMTIADALRNGENVKVRNLGLFKLTNVEARKSVNVNTGEEMEIPSHRKVTFVPDKALADAINTPFASFDTVVLDDALSEDELKLMAKVEDFDEEYESENKEVKPIAEHVAEENEPKVVPPVFRPRVIEEVQEEALEEHQEEGPEEPVNDIGKESEPTDAISEESDKIENDEQIQRIKEEQVNIDEQPSVASNIGSGTSEDEDYCIPEDDDEEYVNESNDSEAPKHDGSFTRGFIWGALTMFVLYLVVGGGYFLYQHVKNQEIIDTALGVDSVVAENDIATLDDVDEVEDADKAVKISESVEKAAPASEADAQPAVKAERPTLRYDTVTSTKFLTKIAYKHYGNSDFWVYIYEENRAKIKNPNTIAPGTVVVVPPAEKYGIDKNSKESLRAARKKIQEIESGK